MGTLSQLRDKRLTPVLDNLFLDRMFVSLGGTATWRLHTGLCKFVQNISTNV